MTQNPMSLGQPQTSSHPKHIAIVGKHQVTALTRVESTSTFPDDVLVKRVDYDGQSSLVDALRGKDVLIITLAVNAPQDQEAKLIEAAAEANVAWVIPNEWGLDSDDRSLAEDSILGELKQKTRRHIESLGKSSWVSLVCGFWYEFSLAGGAERFGFDFPNQQCGRAIAQVLSLDIHAAGDKKDGPTLSQFKNRPVYVSSFLVSQRDMFESVLRVSGAVEANWNVKYEDVKQRYDEGRAEMEGGDMTDLVKLLYARDFLFGGGGNYEALRGLHNGVLSLPREDLDDRTRVTIENM
ncbi:hypothetical protein CKAH01_13786 [Colletotrichum kahawae]|uniref:NmrA-like domain-containing protein n=1 Tax=Colletotrichum kahawae TaxID=34407 RepID=A0AAD9YMA6_COLKA|nr:hypothetical protein CKAH01_13786 [Colletotrichum kahawae]